MPQEVHQAKHGARIMLTIQLEIQDVSLGPQIRMDLNHLLKYCRSFNETYLNNYRTYNLHILYNMKPLKVATQLLHLH